MQQRVSASQAATQPIGVEIMHDLGIVRQSTVDFQRYHSSHRDAASRPSKYPSELAGCGSYARLRMRRGVAKQGQPSLLGSLLASAALARQPCTDRFFPYHGPGAPFCHNLDRALHPILDSSFVNRAFLIVRRIFPSTCSIQAACFRLSCVYHHFRAIRPCIVCC